MPGARASYQGSGEVEVQENLQQLCTVPGRHGTPQGEVSSTPSRCRTTSTLEASHRKTECRAEVVEEEQDAMTCIGTDKRSALAPAAMEHTKLKVMKQSGIVSSRQRRACKPYSTSVMRHGRKGEWRIAGN